MTELIWGGRRQVSYSGPVNLVAKTLREWEQAGWGYERKRRKVPSNRSDESPSQHLQCWSHFSFLILQTKLKGQGQKTKMQMFNLLLCFEWHKENHFTKCYKIFGRWEVSQATSISHYFSIRALKKDRKHYINIFQSNSKWSQSLILMVCYMDLGILLMMSYRCRDTFNVI